MTPNDTVVTSATETSGLEVGIGAILYKTAAFDIKIGVSDAKELPTELRRVYFLVHRGTGVLAGRTNILSDAIWGAEEAQRLLEAALKNPKQRPERELSQVERIALLSGLSGIGGGAN